MYCNSLFPTFQRHKSQKISKYNLSNKAAFLYDQKVKTNIYTSWERKELLRWSKKRFSSFLNAFNCRKLSQNWDCAFNCISYWKKTFVSHCKNFKGPSFYGRQCHKFGIFKHYSFVNILNFLPTFFKNICENYPFRI